MRFLVDANLSPVIAARLREAGHDALHVRDFGLVTASDDEILRRAAEDPSIIISADADFGTLLALGGSSGPSVILLRSADHLAPTQQADLILTNLGGVADALEEGAVVSLGRGRTRVRVLPMTAE